VWPFLSRRRGGGGVLGALVTSALLALTLQIATAGAWLPHLVRSICQPLSLLHVFRQLRAVAPLLITPLAGVVWWGARFRDHPDTAISFPALLTSVAWTLFSLSKVGTADNHWLEPSLAALILLARTPRPAVSPIVRRWLSLAVAVQASVLAGVSGHASFEGATIAPLRLSLISRARQVCGAEAGDIVLAPDVGIEFMVNGRILTTPFEMTYLARAGAFPQSLWMADLESEHIRGVIMENDLLEHPLPAAMSYDRLDAQFLELFTHRFRLAEESGGLRLYRLRSPTEPARYAVGHTGDR
jgi:hypothetical protein